MTPLLLRYDRAVQGLVDSYVSLQGREIGECIYCGQRDAPLETEHAVPYGLNGPWTLLRASCAVCAKITSRFEHEAMRRLWPDVRNALAMQSRRRDKRSTTLPLVVLRDGVRETVQVSRNRFPTYLTTPLFPPPAIFWSNRPIEGVFANLETIHLCGPTFEKASKDYPGIDFLGMHVNFSPQEFARMLAKIGFCAAVASVGLGAFTNTPIRNVILGSDQCVGQWVGSWWKEPVNGTSGGLHEIRVVLTEPETQIHAIIRLFAQFGAPEYHVMLGPADPTYMASDDWPAQWAERHLLNQ
jgi:hypothetical protein